MNGGCRWYTTLKRSAKYNDKLYYVVTVTGNILGIHLCTWSNLRFTESLLMVVYPDSPGYKPQKYIYLPKEYLTDVTPLSKIYKVFYYQKEKAVTLCGLGKVQSISHNYYNKIKKYVNEVTCNSCLLLSLVT